MATPNQPSLFEVPGQNCPLPPFDTEAAARAERPPMARRISAAAMDQGFTMEAVPESPSQSAASDWLAAARATLAPQSEPRQ